MQDKRRLQESESVLESLRIERTSYTQEEFAKRCGIPRRTYMRWISGETEAKLTIHQIKALCKELKILKVDDIPNDFGPNFLKNPTNPTNKSS